MRLERLRRRVFRGRVFGRAFTLMEVVVALSVVLILAAVATPSLLGYLDQKKVEATATQLAGVRDALYNTAAGNVAFWQRITAGASRLSMLTSVINRGAWPAIGAGDGCHNPFVSGDSTRWLNFGPFLNYPISPTTGLVTPIGIAADTLTRVPMSATAGSTRINFINSVTLTNATLLDEYIDASNGNATGIVQWVTPAVNGMVTMYYFVAINNVC
jgi:prepilin-type N-terminal cleavage/methylation domain-containing protein